MSESDDQKAIFDWAKLHYSVCPELELLYATMNGAKLSSVREAQRLKATGMNNGLPDMCLPVARHNWHGLYIEQKFGHNKPSDRQVWWMDRLTEQGYLAVASWSPDETIAILSEYLDIK